MGSAITGLADRQAAALALLRALADRDYVFVPVTPETHRRVVARAEMRRAHDLRGIFGWSLPFDAATLPAGLLDLLRSAELVEETPAGLRSKVRISTVRGGLFLHSAFPTDSADSVFLGPDSLRFADFLSAELAGAEAVQRLVDIGAGAGVGGIVAARFARVGRIELVDVNEAALGLARVNAAHAGVAVHAYPSDGLAAVAPGFDLAIANPPFIIDEGGPAYRDGGDMHGAALSLRWSLLAASGLAPGGRMLLYTGSAIVDGRDSLREALEARLPPLGCAIRYREIDPDIFGEELVGPAYRGVERIAAVGAVIGKAG